MVKRFYDGQTPVLSHSDVPASTQKNGRMNIVFVTRASIASPSTPPPYLQILPFDPDFNPVCVSLPEIR